MKIVTEVIGITFARSELTLVVKGLELLSKEARTNGTSGYTRRKAQRLLEEINRVMAQGKGSEFDDDEEEDEDESEATV